MSDQECRYCGDPIWSDSQPSRPWILLNRYGVGTGKFRQLNEVHDGDGDYTWDVGGDEDFCTGFVLHWPACALAWIEGKMMESDVIGRSEFGDE